MSGGSDLSVETPAQPSSTTTALSFCPLPAGRGRGRTLLAWMQPRILDTRPVPGGLQQQAATGAGPEIDCFGQQETGVSTSAVPAMAAQPASATTALSICPLPAGQGWGRTLPCSQGSLTQPPCREGCSYKQQPGRGRKPIVSGSRSQAYRHAQYLR